MRTIGRLASGLAVVALLPAALSAQSGQSSFKDAWFWGAKVGNMTFWTTQVQRGQAPLVGGEWLITRNHGALYLSLDGEFFKDNSSVPDAANGGERVVQMKDMRRLTVAGFMFPKAFGALRPYGGVGMAVNIIQTVATQGQYVSAAQFDEVQTELEDQKNRASPILIVGAQLQMSRLSVFGQGSYMPAQAGFLLNNNETYFLEAGIRFNVGSSIEKIDN